MTRTYWAFISVLLPGRNHARPLQLSRRGWLPWVAEGTLPAVRDRHRHFAAEQRAGVCSLGLNCACALPWEPQGRISPNSKAEPFCSPGHFPSGKSTAARGRKYCVPKQTAPYFLPPLRPLLVSPVPGPEAFYIETTFPRGLGGASSVQLSDNSRRAHWELRL